MKEEDVKEKMEASRKGSRRSKISLISYTDNANPTKLCSWRASRTVSLYMKN